MVRAFAAGPDGLDVVAIGGPKPEGSDGEMLEVTWPVSSCRRSVPGPRRDRKLPTGHVRRPADVWPAPDRRPVRGPVRGYILRTTSPIRSFSCRPLSMSVMSEQLVAERDIDALTFVPLVALGAKEVLLKDLGQVAVSEAHDELGHRADIDHRLDHAAKTFSLIAGRRGRRFRR